MAPRASTWIPFAMRKRIATTVGTPATTARPAVRAGIRNGRSRSGSLIRSATLAAKMST
jgi:hypothetical protein